MWSENWRVNIDFLSKDYDDRMLSISDPYETEQEARQEYEKAINEYKCCDAPEKPARCMLEHYVWPSPNEYAKRIILEKNY